QVYTIAHQFHLLLIFLSSTPTCLNSLSLSLSLSHHRTADDSANTLRSDAMEAANGTKSRRASPPSTTTPAEVCGYSVITAQDIQTATNNYDCNNRLYREVSASVTYKGTLKSSPGRIEMQNSPGSVGCLSHEIQTEQGDVYRDDLVRILDSPLEACGEVEVLMQVENLAEKCLACSSMGPTMLKAVKRYKSSNGVCV
ncbi:S-locus protein kinase, partial [Striga asiatica]